MVYLPHWPKPLSRRLEKSDLSQVREVLSYLGDPHLKLPPTIHVAGTNGKGSSIAFLRAIFEAKGYKVHTYTSPHLLECNERIVLASEKITDSYLFEILEETRIICEKIDIRLGFFEAITVAAFLAFHTIKADVLLLETGIGGRLDATNVIVDSVASVITSISYDHTAYLGDDILDIAREKAGIISPKSKSIISCQLPKVYEYFIAYCEEIKSDFIMFEYDFYVKKLNNSFIFDSNFFKEEFPLPSLSGDHQLLNVANAIATCKYISDFDIDTQSIKAGITNTVWKARLDKINPASYKKLFQNIPQIWVDGAHNDAGAQALAHFIKANLEGPIFLIVGMTYNRDPVTFLNYFDNLILKGFSVKVTSEVNSYGEEKLALLSNNSAIKLVAQDSLENAIISCAKISKGTGNIIITGSLFLAADFYKLFS